MVKLKVPYPDFVLFFFKNDQFVQHKRIRMLQWKPASFSLQQPVAVCKGNYHLRIAVCLLTLHLVVSLGSKPTRDNQHNLLWNTCGRTHVDKKLLQVPHFLMVLHNLLMINKKPGKLLCSSYYWNGFSVLLRVSQRISLYHSQWWINAELLYFTCIYTAVNEINP